MKIKDICFIFTLTKIIILKKNLVSIKVMIISKQYLNNLTTIYYII